MKILFVGDASNFHNSLAKALTDLGHTCVVASDGTSWMETDRQIDLSRKPGKIGAIRYLFDVLKALPKMRGFDIVHLVNPIFLNFRPERVKPIFKYLRRNNGKIFLSALGTDYAYVHTCYDGQTFRYSDYMVGDKLSPYIINQEDKRQGNWFLPLLHDYHNYIIDNIDGVIACLYEYYTAYASKIPEKLGYGGIPIDTAALSPNFIEEEPEKVKFFIGIQKKRTILKGTDLLLEAARQVQADFPDSMELKVVENMPYAEYVKCMRESHVILDQLYSYTPSTNALLGMAQGLIAVSGAEPEFYNFIGEKDCKPIINVSPLVENDIYNKLVWIIKNKSQLPRLSRQSREFVEKHNESQIVAQRHIDFWNKISKP